MAKSKKFEGSSTDNRRDRAEAKKRGVSVKQYEGSPTDRRLDAAGQNALYATKPPRKRKS